MSDQELIQSILEEYKLTGDTFLTGVLPQWYSLYSNKGSSLLQYYYTKKRVLGYLIFQSSSKIDVIIGGDSFKKSQQGRLLLDLLKMLNDEILAEDPGVALGVATLQSATPYSTLPDSMTGYLDNFVDGCWNGKY